LLRSNNHRRHSAEKPRRKGLTQPADMAKRRRLARTVDDVRDREAQVKRPRSDDRGRLDYQREI